MARIYHKLPYTPAYVSYRITQRNRGGGVSGELALQREARLRLEKLSNPESNLSLSLTIEERQSMIEDAKAILFDRPEAEEDQLMYKLGQLLAKGATRTKKPSFGTKSDVALPPGVVAAGLVAGMLGITCMLLILL